MDDKKQPVEDIDELHNSILSLCDDKVDDKNVDDAETDGDFIKSLIEYTEDDTIQNTMVTTNQDRTDIEFVTVDSIHTTSESPGKGDKGQRSVLEIYDTDKDKSDVKFITVDSIHNTRESPNRENRGQRSLLEICDTSCPSPVVASNCSSAPSPVVIWSGKRKHPDESGDNLEVSSILNTPIQFKNFGKNKSPRKVIYQSTPLDPGGKGMFKASAINAQSTPLNSDSQKDSPYLSQARLNLFKEEIDDELGVLDEDDDPTVTFEDLLSELTMLIDDDGDKEKPTKMRSEELKLLSSVKAENQISRIDLDSLLLEDGKRKSDDVNTSSTSNASNVSYGEPGRFSRLNATVRNTVIEEANEDNDETEDILGLDDYGYSDAELEELSSDEEKTLLFDESALCKTVIKNKSKRQLENQELNKTSDGVVGIDRSSQKDGKCQSSALYITVGSVVDSEDDKLVNEETSIKDRKEFKTEGAFSGEVKAENDITTEKDVSIKIDGVKEIENLDKDISAKIDNENKTTSNICKVSPVTVSISDQKSKTEAKTVLPSDTDKPINENKTVMLNDSIEPASDKMKEVMMRWNSKDIPKPDTNLTYAYRAREHLGLPYGQLEGHHLSTLEKTNKLESSGEQPPAKRQKMGNVTPMCNAKAYLEAQIRELTVIEHNNADEILRERKAVLMNMHKEETQRARMLFMQQDLEIRQLRAQAHYNGLMINSPFYNVQLLQLRQEHEHQKCRLKGMYKEKVEERHRFYFQKVNQRNQQYTHRKEQLNCLLNQLQSQPMLDQEKNNRYGPHVTVDLVKGPCVTNHQTSSVVTVCLPADIAAAIIKEDEIYDMFYEHPKLTKNDYIFKKKTSN